MRVNTDIQLPLKIKSLNGKIIIRCVLVHPSGRGCGTDWKINPGIDINNAKALSEAINHVMEASK